MQLVLSALLSKDIFHYFQINKEFKIISYSYSIDKYFPQMQQIIGSEIRDYLPELIGSEEEILECFDSESYHFELEKVYKNDYYIDITIEFCDTESILIIIQDNTSTVKKQHKLLQYSNELTLMNNILKSVFDQKNSLIFVTDNYTIKYANKKFIEFFGKKNLQEIQKESMQLYKNYNSDFNSYDDILNAISSNRGYVTLNNSKFMLEVVSLDISHKLFTLSRIQNQA